MPNLAPDNPTLHHLAQHFIQHMQAIGQTVATAESCTGGLVCSTLTDVSGSSRVVKGGIISYSNEAKRDLLRVPERILEAFGAVSEPVAIAMARGAQTHFGTDYALSITGIAGPDGGTEEKPVGLVYIGMARPDGMVDVARHVWTYDRLGNKRASVYTCLNMLLTHTEIGRAHV